MDFPLFSATTIPDIPKIFTAIAEWLSCMLCITLYARQKLTPRKIFISLANLLALILVQQAIGILPVQFWLIGMGCALAIMYGTITLTTRKSATLSAYWLMRTFLLAEFMAALEWQLWFYAARSSAFLHHTWIACAAMVFIYGLVAAAAWILNSHQNFETELHITCNQLLIPAIITIITFFISNLSYVTSSTPFSGSIGTESFNIRTLVCLGGTAFLFAYNLQLNETQAKAELHSIRNVLNLQYQQYQQSKETVAAINHKYHDLKHQIAVLREENNLAKRNAYLNEIEDGLRDYESQYKTGNPVVDTILSSKSLFCTHHNITFTCVANGKVLEDFDTLDVSSLLGNALDNAIEAEQRIDDVHQRLIHISITQRNNFAFIQVENFAPSPIQFRNGLPVTTKGNMDFHGFGIKSMLQTAQKYGGDLTVAQENQWFVLKVLLPMKHL